MLYYVCSFYSCCECSVIFAARSIATWTASKYHTLLPNENQLSQMVIRLKNPLTGHLIQDPLRAHRINEMVIMFELARAEGVYLVVNERGDLGVWISSTVVFLFNSMCRVYAYDG